MGMEWNGMILYNGPPTTIKARKDYYWVLLIERERVEREGNGREEKERLKNGLKDLRREFWKGGRGRDQQQS